MEHGLWQLAKACGVNAAPLRSGRTQTAFGRPRSRQPPVSRANPRVSPIAAQPAANVQSQTYCRKINELRITIKSPWVIPYTVLRNHRLSL